MKKYFAYTRVSTDKQGELGVSLQEQKEIIRRYSSHKNLEISRWFEEMETASKIGRPVFNQMLRSLKAGQADGIIIHKVDRGARNFRDWAEIGELVQQGVEVHFATESLDLTTLGGMLSADIQAVMSVHYSRNLREEVKKGYYGRMKQGFCPHPAPLGYLNNGKAKPKTIDPVQGPIVRQAFELYASGRYSLLQLKDELYKLGLRTRETPKKPGGRKVSRNSLSEMLSNPFYIGVLHVKKSGRTFAGIHKPLIPKQLFERVQQVKSGRYVRQIRTHRFLFSRMIECGVCGRSLIGETHKGYVYYRCHNRHAPSTSLSEEKVKGKIAKLFERLKLTPEEVQLVDAFLLGTKEIWEARSRENSKTAELALASLQERSSRLTDAYVENLIDRQEFEKKKTALTLERRETESQLTELKNGSWPGRERWEKIVELMKTAYSLYKSDSYDENREIMKEVMSNSVASGNSLVFTVRFPFIELTKYDDCRFGGTLRGRDRNFWRKLIDDIVQSEQKATASDTRLCA